MAKQTKKNKREAARAKAKAAVHIEHGLGLGSASESSPARISPGLNKLQLVLILSIILLLTSLATNSDTSSFQTPDTPIESASTVENVTYYNGFHIPQELTGPYSDYPNPLGITEEARQAFHPVVKFPSKNSDQSEGAVDIEVLDHTKTSGSIQLATEEQRDAKREEVKRRKFWHRKEKPKGKFAIGRYDENRVNLYASDIFRENSNSVDGSSNGARTLHVGIDLDGPVGTKVYAFSAGTIHSAGYNSELGDYGNVVVIEHDLNGACSNETRAEQESKDSSPCKIWALYGHLDSKSIKRKKVGGHVKKGQVIGRVGDIHENGGWMFPHVHFQLSTKAPETHDMPGAVSMADRPEALVTYPDPRLILGPLY